MHACLLLTATPELRNALAAQVAAASFVTDAPLQKRRRLRHILVPADNSDLFVKLQSELEGEAFTPYTRS